MKETYGWTGVHRPQALGSGGGEVRERTVQQFGVPLSSESIGQLTPWKATRLSVYNRVRLSECRGSKQPRQTPPIPFNFILGFHRYYKMSLLAWTSMYPPCFCPYYFFTKFILSHLRTHTVNFRHNFQGNGGRLGEERFSEGLIQIFEGNIAI